MPDLSIKNVPAEVLDRLKVQARKNHRSLQGELMTILEGAAQQKGVVFGSVAFTNNRIRCEDWVGVG